MKPLVGLPYNKPTLERLVSHAQLPSRVPARALGGDDLPDLLQRAAGELPEFAAFTFLADDAPNLVDRLWRD